MKWCRETLSRKQNLIALLCTLFAALVLWSTLFSAPRKGLLDLGGYDAVLSEFGLSRLETAETGLTEHYRTDGLNWKGLLLLQPTQSLIYPVSVIAALCGLINIPFSTAYLAFFLSVLLLGAYYSILKSLYVWIREKTIVVGAGILFVFFCANYVVPLNSLYAHPMFFVSLALFAAACLRGFAMLENPDISRASAAFPVIITGFLLLTSGKEGIFLFPLVFLPCLYFLFQIGAKPSRILGHLALLLVMIWGCFGFLQRNAFTQIDLYHACFDGVLIAADSPAAALEEMGMDARLAEDAGKSWYYPDDAYMVNPRDSEQNGAIFDHLSYSRILKYYGNHPAKLSRLLSMALTSTDGISTSRFAGVHTDAHSLSNDWWGQLHRLMPKTPGFYVFFLLLSFLAGLALCIFGKKPAGMLLSLGALAGGILLMLSVLSCGLADCDLALYPFTLVFDSCLLGTALSAWCVIDSACRKLLESQPERRKSPPIYPTETYSPIPLPHLGIRTALKKYPLTENRFCCYTLAVCALVLFYVLFLPRIGATNNGDFGRMMDAMQIRYTPADYYKPEEQYLTKVIEDYDFIEPYDWSMIRPSRSLLSQGYVSAFMRILNSLTGLPFSTVSVTVLYAALLLLCIWQFAGTAWRFLGRLAPAAAAGFILLFFGSYNLGWLNSLYGEGIGFVSLMLVVASSIYLIEKKSAFRGFVWYNASVILLVGAKAQYALILPVLIVWEILLVLYRMPPKTTAKLLLVVLALLGGTMGILEAVSVYRNNENISTQDTLVQGLYYGILMVADDPEQALDDLGLDRRLVADTGKHAFLPKEDYFCAPRTPMAEEMIYSKVSSVDYLKWYLAHPKAFFTMMDAAARASADPMPDFLLYTGEKANEPHRQVHKLDVWKQLRTSIVPRHFVLYVLIYGLLLIVCLRRLFRRTGTPQEKMYTALFLVFLACGLIQYPLTVIANGFADNVKQLYLFRETFDGALLVSILWLTSVSLRRIRR